MEILDIVDENNELTGEKETRQYIHENNLWHRNVSCWIINEKGAFHSQTLKKRLKNKKIFRQKEFNLFVIKGKE